MSIYKDIFSGIRRKILVLMLLALCGMQMQAFDLSVYAEKSVLAEGKWVKVSVQQDGIYLLKAEDLKKWGFTDMSRVRVYGYGGRRISDALTAQNYTDDLPLVQTVNATEGVYFFGLGVTQWNTYNGNDFRPANNPFSTAGYYYITENDTPLREIELSGTQNSGSAVTTFREKVFHEKDLYTPSETGHLLLGEDFKASKSYTFDFNLTDKVEGTTVWLETDLVTRTFGSPSTLLFAVNGTTLESTDADVISASANNTYTYGTEKMIRKEFEISGEKLQLRLTLNYASMPINANLNYIAINYTRNLILRNNNLYFTTGLNSDSYTLSGATENTVLWDVTEPNNISQINVKAQNQAISWTSSFGTDRTYIAWNKGAALPSPEYVGTVANQNIHGMETPNMVIFTVPDYAAQAERLAEFHRTDAEDPLSVLVLNQDDVFNEFSSGTADVNSLRRCLKMFYDRGEASGNKLRYLILFGRSVQDNRHVTDAIKALGYPTIPVWESEDGLNDNVSFCMDDIYGFLEDGSGMSFGLDKLMVSIGRIAVTSSYEAKNVVDKIIKYIKEPDEGNWQNQVLLIADDEDNGTHMIQMEKMYNTMLNSNGGEDMFYNKVYIDAYEKSGGTYPGARSDMFRLLEEGMAWWCFVGHANPTSWTADGLMTYTDISSLYLKRLPVVFAYTCNFMRWDSKDISAAEILFKNTNGGVVAALSATRPVYISENGYLSQCIGSYIFAKDENGKRYTIGDAIRLAKNNYNIDGRPISNTNKLRYVFLGDPAMRLVAPSPKIKITDINGVGFDDAEPPTLMASQRATINGMLLNNDGTLMSDFNGVITSTLYDADISTVSKGNGTEGVQVAFDQHGSRLFAGTDSIKGGLFSIKVPMPSEIADNYRNASINMLAYSKTDSRRGVGVNRDFYVYGYDDSAPEDNEAPKIDYFYLNHSSFKDGDKVNESPVAIAQVSDNVAINLSMAGIGHQMNMWLDGAAKSYTDVSQYYTPASDGSPAGTIAYPLSDLTDGAHSLRLRVWDTSGNPTEQTINFFVEGGLPVRAFEVYTDSNPASSETNFYITHNRPDAMVEVTIEVFDIWGRMMWTSVQSGRCDLFTTFPITWNLCDMAGRRVPRGIYIYRASIKSEDGVVSNSLARKLAVTRGQ